MEKEILQSDVIRRPAITWKIPGRMLNEMEKKYKN